MSRLRRRGAVAICGGVLLGLVAIYGGAIASGEVRVGQSGYLVYYATGRLIAQGHGDHIYTPRALVPIERDLLRPLKLGSSVSPYLYPPFFALAVVPLTALPYEAAYVLWILLNLILLCASLLALQRYAGVAGQNRVLWWLAALSSISVFLALAQGQISVILLAAFTLAFLSLRSGRDALAGVALALTLLKFTYIFPFGLVLLLHRRWQALAALAATAVLLVLVPLPVLGIQINREYVDLLRQATHWHVTGFSPPWNQCFDGFMRMVLPRPASTVATALLDLSAIAALAIVTLRSRATDLPYALAVVVALLISPHVLVHDLTLLLIPVAVALRYRRDGPARLGTLLACGYVALLAGVPLAFRAPIQLSVIAMAALAAWLVATSAASAAASAAPITGDEPAQ